MFSIVAALQTLTADIELKSRLESTAVDEKQAEKQTVNMLMFMSA